MCQYKKVNCFNHQIRKFNLKTIASLILYLFLFPLLFAQEVDTLLTFGDVGDDEANGIIITSENNISIIGVSQNPTLFDKDYFVIELDENANTKDSFICQNSYDQIGEDIISLNDNRKIILGTVRDANNYSSVEIKMLEGDYSEIWTKQYGSFNSLIATKILNVNSQYIFVLSELKFERGLYMFLIDLNGEIIWDKSVIEEEVYYHPRGVIQLQNGNYLISGSKSSVDGQDFEGYLMQIDFQGNVIWEKSIPELGLLRNIRELEDQTLIICGSLVVSPIEVNAALVKLDNSGELLFATYYPNGVGAFSSGTGGFIGEDLECNSAGNIFLLCNSSYNSGDIALVTLDSDGNEIERNFYGGQASDDAKSILIDNDNKIHIIGYTESYGIGKKDMLYLRLIDKTLTSSSSALIENDEFIVCPNPISSFARISNAQNYKEFKLFDFNGNEISIFRHQENFNYHNLSPGIYFLKGQHLNGSIIVKKIAVVK